MANERGKKPVPPLPESMARLLNRDIEELSRLIRDSEFSYRFFDSSGAEKHPPVVAAEVARSAVPANETPSQVAQARETVITPASLAFAAAVSQPADPERPAAAWVDEEAPTEIVAGNRDSEAEAAALAARAALVDLDHDLPAFGVPQPSAPDAGASPRVTRHDPLRETRITMTAQSAEASAVAPQVIPPDVIPPPLSSAKSLAQELLRELNAPPVARSTSAQPIPDPAWPAAASENLFYPARRDASSAEPESGRSARLPERAPSSAPAPFPPTPPVAASSRPRREEKIAKGRSGDVLANVLGSGPAGRRVAGSKSSAVLGNLFGGRGTTR